VSVLIESHDCVIRYGNGLYERGIAPNLFHVLIWKGAPCIITNQSKGGYVGIVGIATWCGHIPNLFFIDPHHNFILCTHIFIFCMWLCSHCPSQVECKHSRVRYRAAYHGGLGKECGKGLCESSHSFPHFPLMVFNLTRVITIVPCWKGAKFSNLH